MTGSGITYGRAGSTTWIAMLDEVADLYVAIRSELGQTEGIYTRQSFVDRTTRQVDREGFAATYAREGDRLVGFSFGLRLAPGAWWAGNPTMPPEEILDAPKFAVIELDVAASHRGRGIGRHLINMLLGDRTEPYATLTTTPGLPAREMYARWGWRQIGTAQHTPDAPVMDQLVLPLKTHR
jgi:GNAT superfamily N-acetyltransferase